MKKVPECSSLNGEDPPSHQPLGVVVRYHSKEKGKGKEISNGESQVLSRGNIFGKKKKLSIIKLKIYFESQSSNKNPDLGGPHLPITNQSWVIPAAARVHIYI